MIAVVRKSLLVVTLGAVTLSLGACAGAHGAKAPETRDAGFDVAGDRPASPKTLYTMSRILVTQGREAEAVKLLKDAVAQPPPFLPAYVALAELQLRHDNAPNEALATIDKALSIAPKDPTLHNDRGMCMVAKKDYAAALESFTRAVEFEPQTARYRANRAMAMGMVGKYDECLAAYATVVTPAEAHHNLAVICRIRGDEERARSEATVAESLRARPNSPIPAGAPAEGAPAEPRG